MSWSWSFGGKRRKSSPREAASSRSSELPWSQILLSVLGLHLVVWQVVHSCGGQGTVLQCSSSTVCVLGLPSQTTRVGHSVPSESSAQALKVTITGKMTNKLLQSSLAWWDSHSFVFLCLCKALVQPHTSKTVFVFPSGGLSGFSEWWWRNSSQISNPKVQFCIWGCCRNHQSKSLNYEPVSYTDFSHILQFIGN